jgi:hypothetical protein
MHVNFVFFLINTFICVLMTIAVRNECRLIKIFRRRHYLTIAIGALLLVVGLMTDISWSTLSDALTTPSYPRIRDALPKTTHRGEPQYLTQLAWCLVLSELNLVLHAAFMLSCFPATNLLFYPKDWHVLELQYREKMGKSIRALIMSDTRTLWGCCIWLVTLVVTGLVSWWIYEMVARSIQRW